MGCLTRYSAISVALLASAVLFAPGTSAAISPAASCVTAFPSEYYGDEIVIDIWISEISMRNGNLYLNGQPYPEEIHKRLERFMSKASDELPPDNKNPNGLVNQLNPLLNPVIYQVVGPVIDMIGEMEPDNLPTIQAEVRIPSPEDEPPGVRLVVIMDLGCMAGN